MRVAPAPYPYDSSHLNLMARAAALSQPPPSGSGFPLVNWGCKDPSPRLLRVLFKMYCEDGGQVL